MSTLVMEQWKDFCKGAYAAYLSSDTFERDYPDHDARIRALGDAFFHTSILSVYLEQDLEPREAFHHLIDTLLANPCHVLYSSAPELIMTLFDAMEPFPDIGDACVHALRTQILDVDANTIHPESLRVREFLADFLAPYIRRNQS